jgi:D-inositol-3-phosphate glycosyltransferase
MPGRIAFFCSSPSRGGLELNVLRLAGWLRQRGLDVLLMPLDGTPLHHEAVKAGIPVEPVGPHRKYFDFASARDIASRLRRLGAGTLFVFHRDDLDLAAWIKIFHGPPLKLVYQQHMQLGVSRRDPIHYFRYGRFDAWISPLQWLRNETLSKTWMRPEKVRVIPLGIDAALYRDAGEMPAGRASSAVAAGADADAGPLPSREAARSYFGIPPGGTLFGIIGRIEPGKGQGLLVRGVKKLRDAGHDARLLVVGDATIEPGRARPAHDFSGQLHEAVRELGLSGVVRIHPFMEDARPFYRAVDACVIATSHETYGMVTLEAMASGTPVIGSDFGGTREILGEGRFGMLYRSGDLDDFVRCAAAFIAAGWPPETAAAARDRARNEFSADRECAMIAALLAELHRAR